MITVGIIANPASGQDIRRLITHASTFGNDEKIRIVRRALIGLESALTVWNDEMGLLPWGLARILGITVYLDIPGATAWFAAGFGLLLAVIGVLLALPWSRLPVTEPA